MELWSILWLCLAIGLVVCEAVTVGLFCIWFAVGALGALLVARLGLALWVQLVVFAVLSALALFLVRPLAARFLHTKRTPTNADRVLGRTGQVTQDIDNSAARGQVRTAGQIWTARSSTGAVIPAGSQVRILRIEGVKLFVEPLSSAPSEKNVI